MTRWSFIHHLTGRGPDRGCRSGNPGLRLLPPAALVHRGALPLTADHALQAELAHQPGDAVTANPDVLPVQLPPDLLHAVDAEVLGVHAPDLDLQLLVAEPAGRGRPAPGGVVGGRGDLPHPADRLPPPTRTGGVRPNPPPRRARGGSPAEETPPPPPDF